jgi:hypothetical protein
MTADCRCDITYLCQPCLEAAWRAANPGLPSPWDAPRIVVTVRPVLALGPGAIGDEPQRAPVAPRREEGTA